MKKYYIGNNIIYKTQFDFKWDDYKFDISTKYLNQNNTGPLVQSTGNSINLNSVFLRFESFIKKQAYFLYKKQFEIDKIWINRYPTNSYIDLHNHPHTDIVVVGYLEVDINDNSSSLLIENDVDKKFITIDVKENDVLFFSGCVKHKSLPNKSKRDRYIIGMNLNFKRENYKI